VLDIWKGRRLFTAADTLESDACKGSLAATMAATLLLSELVLNYSDSDESIFSADDSSDDGLSLVPFYNTSSPLFFSSRSFATVEVTSVTANGDNLNEFSLASVYSMESFIDYEDNEFSLPSIYSMDSFIDTEPWNPSFETLIERFIRLEDIPADGVPDNPLASTSIDSSASSEDLSLISAPSVASMFELSSAVFFDSNLGF
jgi:hypothetical protein